MPQKNKISLVHIIILTVVFYFSSIGFAFLASLFEPIGVTASFNYWQGIKAPSYEEYMMMETARTYSGLGVIVAVVVVFIGSIVVFRRYSYHWLNSLLAIILMVGVGFVLKQLNYNPNTLMLRIASLLKASAIPANAGAGSIFTAVAAFIFFTYKKRLSQRTKINQGDLQFQFEEINP